jgi:hypothetical protein
VKPSVSFNVKTEKRLIHRSAAGVIYEDNEDYLMKKKKKQEVRHLTVIKNIVLRDSWMESNTIRAVHGFGKFCKRRLTI